MVPWKILILFSGNEVNEERNHRSARTKGSSAKKGLTDLPFEEGELMVYLTFMKDFVPDFKI